MRNYVVRPSGNDPEPLVFQTSAQTFYATDGGAAARNCTGNLRFTIAALNSASSSGIGRATWI